LEVSVIGDRDTSAVVMLAEGLSHALRHCERSEAIQNLSAEADWIASLRSQ
jgi:hypothetical protein